MNRSRVPQLRLLFAFFLVSLCFAPGCVERNRLEPDLIPLWERYDSEVLSTDKREFVLREIEIGGRIECTGEHFFEQTTEVYARTRLKINGEPARVRQIYVGFDYLSGVMKGTHSTQRNYDSDRAIVKEKIRVNLNPGGECSCVKVMGIMWVGKHNPVASEIICPEKP